MLSAKCQPLCLNLNELRVGSIYVHDPSLVMTVSCLEAADVLAPTRHILT